MLLRSSQLAGILFVGSSPFLLNKIFVCLFIWLYIIRKFGKNDSFIISIFTRFGRDGYIEDEQVSFEHVYCRRRYYFAGNW